uniref:tRNA threonylcarbamoyladenosine biosynthesis protein TsaE n=1 Tax=candidate division WWE3 bacterium TaxID=2053526 RepID=A0A7C4XGG9_UNCKA
MEVLSLSTDKTKELAELLAKKLEPGHILSLYGDLGAGKTTFTSFLVSALGITDRVQSPTFVLARRYTNNNSPIKTVNHVDLYRLQSYDEVKDIGLFDILEDSDSITIIEWPEIVEKYLPEQRAVKIKFDYEDENTRRIQIQNLY